jgi:hypothetical protein
MDPRTQHMSEGALVCRANSGRHQLPSLLTCLPKTLAPGQRFQQVERTCVICGYRVVEVYTVPRLNRVSRAVYYPEGYLKHPDDLGNGRISLASVLEALGDRLWGKASSCSTTTSPGCDASTGSYAGTV